MVLDCLVKNYYELRGTFDGMGALDIGVAVEEVAERLGIDWIDVCCAMQGYPWVAALKPSQVAALRRAYYSGNVEAVKSAFEGKSLVDVKKLLGVRKAVGKYSKMPESVDDDIERLLAEYYKHDLTNLVQMGRNRILPFSEWLLLRKASPEDVVKAEKTKDFLVQFEVKEGVKPTVYCGKLICPKKFTEDEIRKIQVNAIARAMLLGSPMQRWAQIPLNTAIFMSYEKPKDYLDLLDYSETIGLTYAECVKELGISVPDLHIAFSYAGSVFLSLDDNILVLKSSGFDWELMNEMDFYSLLQKNSERRNLEVDAAAKYVRGLMSSAGVETPMESTHEIHSF